MFLGNDMDKKCFVAQARLPFLGGRLGKWKSNSLAEEKSAIVYTEEV